IDQAGFSSSVNGYPVYMLETPVFDFSTKDKITLDFDFMCIGGFWNTGQGGNMSYSKDGGLTWHVMTQTMDPLAENWYDVTDLYELNNQPGWANFYDWAHALYHADFLGGEANVRFRFNFRSEIQPFWPGRQGFRLDNFRIDVTETDLEIEGSTDVNALLAQPSFETSYNLYNFGNYNIQDVATGMYWSADTLFDPSDLLIGQFGEGLLSAQSNFAITRQITYPTPILQTEYYLFSKADDTDTVHETDELNNLIRTKVVFDATNVGLVENNKPFSFSQLENHYILQCPSAPNERVSITLLNDCGQTVTFANLTTDEAGRASFPVSDIAVGVYLVR
ncbi:MAG TPA: CARDB domain-containing protein, partial [Bacillota bacterium]|nr:CARDB domain-containing protein [Bacillota bacterium]